MDFNSLLNKAATNATKVTKTLESVDSELARDRKKELRKIEVEKRAKMEQIAKRRAEIPKREPTPEKKFVIPKKKSTEPTVDVNGIKNFLAKKEEAKRASDIQKKKDKDNLIQLRMQTFKGKANKKMGKHFGMDPVDIQIRYGNDHTHVERLQKQQWREEEELDNLSTQYRGGVYKAIQERNKKELAGRSERREPHRVATSKADSIAGLSSRHAAPKEVKKEKPASPPVATKRPAAAPVDFTKLMQMAADTNAGKKVDISALGPSPPKIPRLNGDSRPSSSKDTRPVSNSHTNHHAGSSNGLKKTVSMPSASSKYPDHGTSAASFKPKMSTPSSSIPKRPETSSKPTYSSMKADSSNKKIEKDQSKKDPKGRFVKAPTPPPVIPPAVLGKRYLPGDVRYKQQQEMLKAAGLPSSSLSSNQPKKPDMQSLFGGSSSRKEQGEISKVRPVSSSGHGSSSSAQRRSEPSKMQKSSSSTFSRENQAELEQRRRALEKKRREKERYERMSLVERERERERQNFREEYGYQNDDDDEEEDEYDSEDDFIDDTGYDMDDFNRMDFEETLKMVNPKYNKKKWNERERMISERDMETNYRTVAREEARSARLGFMEDVFEAKKNKSVAL